MPFIGYPEIPADLSVIGNVRRWGLRKRLSAVLIPAIAAIIIFTGFAQYRIADHYLEQALDRTVLLQVLGQATAMEEVLDEARLDLLSLAMERPSREDLTRFLQTNWSLDQGRYVEAGFLDAAEGGGFYIVNYGGHPEDIPRNEIGLIRPSPLQILGEAGELRRGDVFAGELFRVSYPTPQRQMTHAAASEVLRLATPVVAADGRTLGYVVVGINGVALRNVLSLYNSPKSPIYAYARTPEKRFSYYFDLQGWMLFQSENIEEPNKELSTSNSRSGYTGDYTLPYLETAFRPDASHEFYWQMLVNVGNDQHGILNIDMPTMTEGRGPGHYTLGYAPIHFRGRAGAGPQLLGGVAFMDKSRLPSVAESSHISLIVVVTFVAMLVVGLLIHFYAKFLAQPIKALEGAVAQMAQSGELTEIATPSGDRETESLRQAINQFIRSLSRMHEELEFKDRRLADVQQRERAFLSREAVAEGGMVDQLLPELIGSGPVLRELKEQIVKAAAADGADVLIIGETGTGKELTARAIHEASRRSDAPFVSVNCGALNETLLLDELFGHVKGAFTEAKSDRKGAFQAAHGGTLFLDEIGNASVKVQQALLRALSVRRYTPVGSDQEIAVDVRLIAATNVDLRGMTATGAFREDLYYRLKVISLQTPPLRRHKEDIPMLVGHFLAQTGQALGKPGLGLSRGALERLQRHDWPGNVRELKNCLVRAVAMAEGPMIYSEDIVFDTDVAPGNSAGGEPSVVAERQAPPEPMARKRPNEVAAAAGSPLSARQQLVLPYLAERRTMTRQEYQRLVGQEIPPRTAQHDLQDMVAKGLLRKVGSGPATHYVLAEGAMEQDRTMPAAPTSKKGRTSRSG